MIWIKPDQTYNLTNELGSIFWNSENSLLYGIDKHGMTGKTSVRNLRLLSDLSEDVVFQMRFPDDVQGDSATLTASWISGQIGVLVNRKAPVTGTSFTRTIPCVYYFQGGGIAAYNNLYGGTVCFAKHARIIGTYLYHFNDSDGNFARWDSQWDTKNTPEKAYQLVPWRGEHGAVRSIAWATNPESSMAPSMQLVVASPTGAMRWAEMSKWHQNTKVMPIYKEVGIIKCSNLSDITIDRTNNILWILDGGKKLHLVNLEPFGDEEDEYTNTPKALQMTPEHRVVDPLQEMTIEAQLLDMWGQPVELADQKVQFVSEGLGEFYISGDGDNEKWGVTVTTNTDGDGIARAVYRGSESNS